MSKWVLLGLQTGIKTTPYPYSADMEPGISPGRPCGTLTGGPSHKASVIPLCPTGAIRQAGDRIVVDYGRCIQCFRCTRGTSESLDYEWSYEWARSTAEDRDASRMPGNAFTRSLHIRVVDAGACRSCLSEIEQLGKPYYNIHRLGFFMTPSPRQADVLLVAGPVTDNMRLPLQKAYDAMPAPKRVVAVGTCALSGGVFGPSFTAEAGVASLVPMDVAVPGCPPPPLALIHGLLIVSGRQAFAPDESTQVRGGGPHND